MNGAVLSSGAALRPPLVERLTSSEPRTAVWAGLAGVLAGVAVGGGPVGLLVTLGTVALVGAGAVLVNPQAGLLVLAALVVTRASDVAIDRYDLPSLMQPMLAVLVLGVLWQAVWHRRPLPWLRLPAVLLMAYAAVLATGLFAPVDPESAGFYFTAYLRDAVIALVVVAALRSVRALQQVVWALVVAGLVLSAMGVYQYTTGSFGNDFGGFAKASVLNIVGSTDDYRISGPIEDPNYFAQQLAVIVPLAAGRLLWSRTMAARVVAGAALVVLVLAIVFTFSRGAFLALAVLALLFVVRLRPPAPVLLALAAAVPALLLVLPPEFADRLLNLTGLLSGEGSSEASLSGRLSAQLAGIGMFLDNPVLGVGIGQFPSHYADYAKGLGVNTANVGLQPHNLYLEVAAETGIVGLLVFGAILGLVFTRLAASRRTFLRAGRCDAAHLVGDVRLALIGYLLCGLFVHNAYPRVFWLVVGLCLALPAVAEGYARTGRTTSTATSVPA